MSRTNRRPATDADVAAATAAFRAKRQQDADALSRANQRRRRRALLVSARIRGRFAL